MTVEEPIKELKEKKNYKVVIRDPEHSKFNLFNKLAKLCLFCLKILGLLILIPVILGFMAFVTILVISLGYLSYGLFFNGITIAILGGIIFTYLIIKFILMLIFNRKFVYKNLFVLFVVGISLIGIGLGLSISAFSEFSIYEEPITKEKKTTLVIEMADNLVIHDITEIPSERISIDDNLKEIKVDVISYGNSMVTLDLFNSYAYNDEKEEYYDVKRAFIDVSYDNIKEIKRILNDLKAKKINIYDGNKYDYQIDRIYISRANLTKLKENSQKYEG